MLWPMALVVSAAKMSVQSGILTVCQMYSILLFWQCILLALAVWLCSGQTPCAHTCLDRASRASQQVKTTSFKL